MRKIILAVALALSAITAGCGKTPEATEPEKKCVSISAYWNFETGGGVQLASFAPGTTFDSWGYLPDGTGCGFRVSASAGPDVYQVSVTAKAGYPVSCVGFAREYLLRYECEHIRLCNAAGEDCVKATRR